MNTSIKTRFVALFAAAVLGLVTLEGIAIDGQRAPQPLASLHARIAAAGPAA